MLKAVRSDDLNGQSWQLISWPAVTLMAEKLQFVPDDGLVDLAIVGVTDFLSGGPLDRLVYGWACLSMFIQKSSMSRADFEIWLETVDGGLSCAPYYALKRTAQTCHEGAEKYGSWNWLFGFPVDDLLNHCLQHLFRWTNGLASDEDDLGHCLWGMMAAVHTYLYMPERRRQLLGPNCSLTPEIREDLARLREPKTAS